MAVQARMFKAVDNLCAVVDERIAKNLNTLENESDMLGNSDIMMKLKTALTVHVISYSLEVSVCF